MPDYQLVPVDHDPFTSFVPVDHDPFATDQDEALSRSMTHYSEPPNPAQPYIQGTKDFLKGGLSEVLKGQGVQLPDWSNRVGDVLQSEAANTAIGMAVPLKGVGALEKAAAESPSITAYHGSPHDFDRFDLSKIGTGEGSQSYGHGLYFAENPETAESYQKALAGKSDVTAEQLAQQSLHYSLDAKEAAQALRNRAASERRDPFSSIPPEEMERAAALLEGGWKPSKGRMYQVSIKADPEHFLDWDKPLSEQPPEVQQKLKKAGVTVNPNSPTAKNYTMDAMLSDLALGGVDPNAPGTAILHREGAPKASEALRAAGIPGIKYLDQQSRAMPIPAKTPAQELAINAWQDDPQKTIRTIRANYSGQIAQDAIKLIEGGWTPQKTPEALKPTRNYVVFDDKLIDILKKYGIAGIGALPAMGAYHFKTQQVDHDPFAQ